MSFRLDDDWTDDLADELALALRCAPLSLREAQRELWAADDAPLAEEEVRAMIGIVFRRADVQVPGWRAQLAGGASPATARRLEVERLEERKLLSALLFLPC